MRFTSIVLFIADYYDRIYLLFAIKPFFAPSDHNVLDQKLVCKINNFIAYNIISYIEIIFFFYIFI